MQLDELVVEGFRKLTERHVVRPAPIGITVVSGDNEEGKSTLLDALKRGFFMKHNTGGSDREAIQALGQSMPPFVAVGFRLAGRPYRLEKHFRRAGVRLEGPDGVLEGDAAELALARLLAFEWPGRGAAKTEQMGLAGLLWVDQGTTFSATQQPSPSAMQRLAPALADQVASLGQGEQAPRLIAEIRRQRDRFWTGARGQAKGELAELDQALAGLRAELAELETAEAAVEDLLDRLARSIERRGTWLARDNLGRARQELERVRSALARVRALEEEARIKAAEQKALAGELARLRDQATRRQALVDQIAGKVTELSDLAAEAEAAAPALDRARRARAAADQAELTAGEEAARREEELRARTRGLERWRLERTRDALARTLEVARAAARTAAELEGQVAAESLTHEELATLEAETARLSELRATLRNVATRLVLAPTTDDARIKLDGRPIDPAGPLELTAPAVLEIAGFGRIEVTPGGERLAELRNSLHDGEAALEARLRASAVGDVTEARRRLQAKDRRAGEAAAARQRLADLLASSGMPDLTTLEAAIFRASARLDELADMPLAETADEEALERAEKAAEGDLRHARERWRQLAAARARAAAEETELAREADHRRFAEARLAQEQARLEERLAIEREDTADAALETQLSTARAAADAASEALARIERELTRSAADRVQREADQAERRLQQLEEEGKSLDRDVERLTAELKGAGGHGIGDRKAEVLGRLELTARRHGRLLAEAQAWRLLAQTVEAIDRARQDALVEPLAGRVRPYLRELMGEAGLDFAPESLQVASLRRGSRVEAFGSLSIGTREQLAVLVRLAMAELLLERVGECPPLILDDALVYADALRLARMKAILERAGARQQIIILTCRKEDYLGLDARFLTLDDCRGEGAGRQDITDRQVAE